MEQACNILKLGELKEARSIMRVLPLHFKTVVEASEGGSGIDSLNCTHSHDKLPAVRVLKAMKTHPDRR